MGGKPGRTHCGAWTNVLTTSGNYVERIVCTGIAGHMGRHHGQRGDNSATWPNRNDPADRRGSHA